MPRFPRTETDLVPLVDQILSGTTSHPEIFSNADPEGLRAAYEAYRIAKDRQMEAFEAYKAATEPKELALDALIDKTKLELKQAEVDAKNDPGKLSHIGWGWSTAPEELKVPGPPQSLALQREGTAIRLCWGAPPRGSGGRVQAFEVERRRIGSGGEPGEWRIVTVAFDAELLLEREPTGTLEYRVIARNRKGPSEPSNSVTVQR